MVFMEDAGIRAGSVAEPGGTGLAGAEEGPGHPFPGAHPIPGEKK
jgi:hypothetical protein